MTNPLFAHILIYQVGTCFPSEFSPDTGSKLTVLNLSQVIEEEEEEEEDEDGGGKFHPPKVMEQEKRIRREIANSNERRRMQSINAGFSSLRSLLPHHEGIGANHALGTAGLHICIDIFRNTVPTGKWSKF